MDGTSPREWGKRKHTWRPWVCPRNIPTRVGKTRETGVLKAEAAEHPHASGENGRRIPCTARPVGTSPREWGKLIFDKRHVCKSRNIPTRVGKTSVNGSNITRDTEHPHASGENTPAAHGVPPDFGTSPREWGKLECPLCHKKNGRNIPTRVGKTILRQQQLFYISEHPHASGENWTRHRLWTTTIGTSPREWGKRTKTIAERRRRGNIPTRVGKTLPRTAKDDWCAEHPHASGENLISPRSRCVSSGTSPREWGKLDRHLQPRKHPRNIPTRVGKTCRRCPYERLHAEHPHASGENQRSAAPVFW